MREIKKKGMRSIMWFVPLGDLSSNLRFNTIFLLYNLFPGESGDNIIS